MKNTLELFRIIVVIKNMSQHYMQDIYIFIYHRNCDVRWLAKVKYDHQTNGQIDVGMKKAIYHHNY